MIRRAAAWLAVALLVGCASPSAPLPGEHLAGRLSVRVADDAARSFNAAFELDGTAERGRLVLTTPIGTQVAQADWGPGRVRLRTGDGERAYPDLDSLAADALGERVPLAALFDWLRGRAWSGAPSRAQASGFEQLGWRVDLARQGEGWIEAHREDAPAVRLRAKLDPP